jgi:glycosyltransferase involved in cell wall biosynthesis
MLPAAVGSHGETDNSKTQPRGIGVNSMDRKPAIGIVFPRPRGEGGALSVTAWIIHSLQDHYRLTVMTLDRCDPARLNAAFGTAIRADAVQWISFEDQHPKASTLLTRLDMVTLDQYACMRWAQSNLSDDMLPLSTNNEMTFGRRGLQYVNFPMLTVGRRDVARLIGQSGSFAKEILGRVFRFVFLIKDKDLRYNHTLCNSQWARATYEDYYGAGAAAGWLYPPCTMSNIPPHDDWLKRESGIIILGRLVPKKRLEDGLRIVRALREAGHGLHVHLVSSGGDAQYRKRLDDEFGGENWVHREDAISREALMELINTHRYGMHCNHNEHFGMATAEMSGSGCLVLGHNSGGTCEILPDEAQRYDSVEEGVARLAQIHTNAELQSRLLALQRDHTQQFNTDTFTHQVRRWIEGFLGAADSPSATSPQPPPMLDD